MLITVLESTRAERRYFCNNNSEQKKIISRQFVKLDVTNIIMKYKVFYHGLAQTRIVG